MVVSTFCAHFWGVCLVGSTFWAPSRRHQRPGGSWQADQQYEEHISFRWDRQQLSRMLHKWTSHQQLLLTKSKRSMVAQDAALLFNLADEEKGVHPHHVTLELDTSARARLLSVMSAVSSKTLGAGRQESERALSTYQALPPTVVVDKLKRRLRKLGFRGNMTLQMVPKMGSWLSVLHLTPLRASRSLALRYLSYRAGLSMSDVSLLTFPRKQGAVEAGLSLSAYTSDFPDLVAGWHKVWALSPSNRLGFGITRSLSADYREPALDDGAEDDELAPIEKLGVVLSAWDLEARVSVTKDVARVVQVLV